MPYAGSTDKKIAFKLFWPVPSPLGGLCLVISMVAGTVNMMLNRYT